MKMKILRDRADYLGITGSLLCLIHCLATPILLLTSTLVRHDTLRMGYVSLDYFFIGLNIIAVYFASLQTTQLIRRSLWGFLGVFAVGIVLEEISAVFEYAAYMASLGLVFTHIANLRHKHRHHFQ